MLSDGKVFQLNITRPDVGECAQPVTHQVEGQDRQEHEQRGNKDDLRVIRESFDAIGYHSAPGGCRRREADA